MEQICVIGAGYVGLVTGACLSKRGHEVVCLDIDTDKVRNLSRGRVPFFEPGLDELVRDASSEGRLRFTTNYREAIPSAGFIFVAVETPAGFEGQADLVALKSAVCQMAPLLSPDAVVINKSTVPIGTGDLVTALIDRCTSVQFSVVSNPEFLREGSAVRDFNNPDRIVLGCDDRRAAEAVAGLYGEVSCPILYTDIRTAEMIKYASNAYLATKISFINEISTICESLGADVTQVAYGMGLDSRIGKQFLSAGIGWGGSCFPKDVRALIHMAAANGSHPQLLRAVVEINRDQRLALVSKLRLLLGHLDERRICLLGLAFKPDTDDMRNAPSLELATLLRYEGCDVSAYDPAAGTKARSLLPFVNIESDPYAAAYGSDAVVIVTEWEEFTHIDLKRLRSVVRTPVVVDGRNLLNAGEVRDAGFVYTGVGRAAVSRQEPAGTGLAIALLRTMPSTVAQVPALASLS